MDDILIVGDSNPQLYSLYDILNSLHENIKFTSEVEIDGKIAFLDVLLQRRADGFLSRGVYHKSTWSGQYLHFRSFAPMKYKRGLVRTLFHRVRRISTEDNLEADEKIIFDALIENGYPLKFITKYSKPPLPKPEIPSVPPKNIFISLPFKGDDVSILIKRRLSHALQRTFYMAKLVFIEETFSVPTSPRKDPIDLSAKSNVIYEFSCTCGCRYTGRTTRQLGMRISEHIPKWLTSNKTGTPRSAVTKHLQETGHQLNPLTAFKIIYCPKLKHNLKIAEAVAIRLRNPTLCVQKQMVTNLCLPW
jgi:hypothetical protein